MNLSIMLSLMIFEESGKTQGWNFVDKVASWRDLYGIDGVDLDIEVIVARWW